MRKPRALLACAVALVFAGLAGSVWSADVLDARIFTVPAQPYIGQPFELHVVVDTTPGCELRDLTIDGLPGADVVALGKPDPLPTVQAKAGGRTVARHEYVGAGRGVQAVASQVQATVQATLVERRSVGFFSSWVQAPWSQRLPAFALTVRALPTAGRPADFAGAIGVFGLTGTVQPSVVAPNDIVNVTFEVSGQGYLGAATVVLPEVTRDFKAYPPQELERDPKGRLVLRQVVIPLNTNATLVGRARFAYFDPQAGAYRVATAGPFPLRLTARREEAAPTVRRIATPTAAPVVGAPLDVPDAITLELRKIAPFALAMALAAVLGAVLRPHRPRLALLLALAVFVGGATAGSLWQRRHAPRSATLSDQANLRLAPADTARTILALPAGTRVEPLEHAAGWVRVAAAGRRGWVPANRLRAE